MIIWVHAAYLRAKEDYLMGINFSRLLIIKIWQCDFELSEYPLYGNFSGKGDDLCSGHDCATENGKSETVCQDSVLSCSQYIRLPGKYPGRGIPGSGRICLVSVTEAVQGKWVQREKAMRKN